MHKQLAAVFLTSWIVLMGASTGSLATTSTPSTPKVDLVKGQQIVTQVCAACHGADGNSAVSANPNLAGQHPEYLQRQLDHFKLGLRKNAVMAPMASMLSAEDMRAVAVYFAQQTPKLKPIVVKDDTQKKQIALGQIIYRGGVRSSAVPACAGCHSPNGAGLPAQYPRLSGQFSDYTFSQLKAFKAGERGGSMMITDANGKEKEVVDSNGKVMQEIAARMSEEEMRAVAEYLAALR